MTATPSLEAAPTAASTSNSLFPIFLKLEQLHTLIVGGGYVGLEKIRAVLHNSPNAVVTLVGREIRQDLRVFAANYPNVTLKERVVTPDDLEGQQLIIAATDDPLLHQQLRNWAKDRNVLINVADTPAACDFYLGSVVQKGDLKIAISTNGKSPTVAKRLKESLQADLPEALDHILQRMPAIRSQIKGDFTEKVRVLDTLTASIAAGEHALTVTFPHQNLERIGDQKWRRLATAAMTAFGLLLIFNVISFYVPPSTWADHLAHVDRLFWVFIGVGFLAQLVDGLLGMGYGVVTQLCLMGAGVPLAAVSASIHTAEVFTAGASGYSHYRFGNVNRRLVRAMLIPGMIGAVLGAGLLSWVGSAYAIYVKPILAIYALLLGVRILVKALRKSSSRKKVKHVGWLATAGGFLDAFGGGGWGPLVTSTLLAKGKTPQYVIGSVSLTEFFVTLATAITFLSMIGLSHWPIIAGLLVGGVLAAPLSARLAGKLPVRVMTISVGAMIIFWSAYLLLTAKIW